MNVKSLGTVLFLCLLMTGCGGGGGSSSAPGPATISGQAVKGPIAGGTVTAYAIAAGAPGNALDSTITDADGNYSLTIEGYSGPMLLEITGGSFIDEATGAAIDLPATPGSGLRAVIGSVAGGNLEVQITPLTTLAAARAAQMSGGLTTAGIDAANQQLGAYFGGIDLLATSPIDPTVDASAAGALQAEIDYGLILGGLSQLAELLGVDPLALVMALAEDIGDGSFDGESGGAPVVVEGDPLPATAGDADLAAAIGTFSAGASNLSGGTVSSALLDLIAGGGPQSVGAVVELKAGIGYTCARLGSGAVKCWGANEHFLIGSGQLGLGDMEHRGDDPGEMGDNLPVVDLGTGRTAVRIAAGSAEGYHTCAVLDDGSARCWGMNSNLFLGARGILGIGDGENRGDGPGEMGDNLPAIDLGAGRKAVRMELGRYHTCALLDNGTVKCWGWNFSGQLGQGDTVDRGGNPGEMGDSLPAIDFGAGRTVVALAAGENSNCALLDNAAVKCWGNNGSGELGLGDTAGRGDGPGEMGDNLPAVDLGG